MKPFVPHLHRQLVADLRMQKFGLLLNHEATLELNTGEGTGVALLLSLYLLHASHVLDKETR